MGGAVTAHSTRLVPVGRVSGAYGIKGWLRVRSATEPREQILAYAPWHVRLGAAWVTREIQAGRARGDEVLVKVVGVDDRASAERYLGADVAVSRCQLPALDADEYYWCDLIGLEVVDGRGHCLGRVERLMETGANDVLVVTGERERLIPFVMQQVVLDVDTRQGRIIVDWDPDF